MLILAGWTPSGLLLILVLRGRGGLLLILRWRTGLLLILRPWSWSGLLDILRQRGGPSGNLKPGEEERKDKDISCEHLGGCRSNAFW